MSTTPGQIALNLGVHQKTIRAFLREEFGSLPVSLTRWELDSSAEARVRARFTQREESADWLLEPGARVRRRDLHAVVGGNRQSGIVTLRDRPDIVIFSNPSAGHQFGYDSHEGLREDGSFAYTGEGQRGHQQFVKGNRALRDSGPSNRPIRLFLAEGVWITYVGEFATGEPTFEMHEIADADGLPRQGIIFNLVPVDADIALLQSEAEEAGPKYLEATWFPPDASDLVIGVESTDLSERTVSRLEFALQSEFGEWMRARGDSPSVLTLRVDGSAITPDFWFPSTGWIVEAKRSVGRGYVREAIGQVLDYALVAQRLGLKARPAVLLPSRPTQSLVDLLHVHSIILIYRFDHAFMVVEVD